MSKENIAGDWLPLLNYSTKYGISLSTLRRRIKSNMIQFKLESGKYFILENAPRESRGVSGSASHTSSVPLKSSSHVASAASSRSASHLSASGGTPSKSTSAQNHETGKNPFSLNASSFVEASVLSSANRLVEEIKSAYAKILQEKEEQIAQFKEEVSDLRMLVRILEQGANQKVQTATAHNNTNIEPSYSPEPYVPEAFSSEQKELGVSPENNFGETPNEDIFFGDFQNREI